MGGVDWQLIEARAAGRDDDIAPGRLPVTDQMKWKMQCYCFCRGMEQANREGERLAV